MNEFKPLESLVKELEAIRSEKEIKEKLHFATQMAYKLSPNKQVFMKF